MTYAFILFVFSAAFTPGPNNIMIMTSGLNHGIRASVPHLMGIVLGVPMMFLAVGFGLVYAFQVYPWIHVLIQVLGVLYLLYLAWLIGTSAPCSLDGEKTSKPFTFFQAALFQWINPKAWMMGTGAIAAFTVSDQSLQEQIFMMAFVFCLMALPSAGVWLFFGSWLKRVFANPKHLLWFNRAMGLVLAVSIIPVVLSLLDH